MTLVTKLIERAEKLAADVPKRSKTVVTTSNRVATQRLFAPYERARAEANGLRNIGEKLPPMTRLGGPAKAVAQAVGKGILRVGQIITRDQRAFNTAIIRALDALRVVVAAQEHALREGNDVALAELEARVAALEAAAQSPRKM